MPKMNPQDPRDFQQAIRKAVLSQRGEFDAEDLREQLDSKTPPQGDDSSIAQTLQNLVRQQEIIALPSHRSDGRVVYAVCKIEGDPHG